ncbi:hypothetical protein ACOMHN_039091 [Nucella lapillus]
MGGAVSTGDDNDELVDNLVEASYIKSPSIERVFRAVDRASYFLPDHAESAYKDLAWKHGHLHLSAPCIYSEVLESLQLRAGQSFLNLGSGTGYLSTMAGLVLGAYGINHGVEIHDDVVNYAREKLEEFKAKSQSFDEYDFCEPQFVAGNCLQLNSGCRLYDRVYCGAACPAEHGNYMKNLVRVGGILVMPFNDQLLRIQRVTETEWVSKNVLPVSFATLQTPSKEKADVVDLPECHVLNLQEICRHNVRSIIRDNICLEIPNVLEYKQKQRPPKPKRIVGRRGRLVNIVPMNMGMVIFNNVNDSSDEIDEDDDDDDDDEDEEENIRLCTELGPSKTSDDDEVNEDEDEGNVSGNDEENTATASTTKNSSDSQRSSRSELNTKRKLRQASIAEESEKEAAACEALNNGVDADEDKNEARPTTVASSSSTPDNKRSSPSSFCQDWEEQNGCGSKRMRCVDMQQEEEEEKEDAAEGRSRDNKASDKLSAGDGESVQEAHQDLSSEDSDGDSMDVDSLRAAFQAPPTPTSVLNALHLLSIPRKVRCSSSTSADTSETSGFGSFGDEPLDLVAMNADRDSPPPPPHMMMADRDFSHRILGKRGSGVNGNGNHPPSCLEETSLESLASSDKKASPKTSSDSSDASQEGTTAAAAAPGDQYSGPPLGQLMKERVLALPLPMALRSYLAYYRV